MRCKEASVFSTVNGTWKLHQPPKTKKVMKGLTGCLKMDRRVPPEPQLHVRVNPDPGLGSRQPPSSAIAIASRDLDSTAPRFFTYTSLVTVCHQSYRVHISAPIRLRSRAGVIISNLHPSSQSHSSSTHQPIYSYLHCRHFFFHRATRNCCLIGTSIRRRRRRRKQRQPG